VNPIFQWLIAHTIGKALARRCPNCRREQIVPREKAHESVRCQHCGQTIPPPKTK
jgi:ribosomal protein S27E